MNLAQKPRLSLLFSLILLPTLSWSGESCNALLNLGLYNVSQSSNASDAESLKKSTFCSADYSKSETSQSQKAQIEASYGLFSGGAGGSVDSSSIITTQKNICTSGFDSSKYSSSASDYSKTVYQGTLDAWNRCQVLANKGLDFEVQSSNALTGVTVIITPGAGNSNTFNGLHQDGLGRANCSMTLPSQGNSLSGRVINVNESTSFTFNAANKVTISCSREMQNNGTGDLSADAVDLSFVTSADTLRVPLAKIGSLSRATVDQVTAQIKAAVNLDTQNTVSNALTEPNNAIKNLKDDLAKGNVVVASALKSTQADKITNTKTSCTWNVVKTHGTFTCPDRQFAAGICLTNEDHGCTNGVFNNSGDGNPWVVAGAIKCCSID